MWPSQDKEFVGHKISKICRTMLVKKEIEELEEIPVERNTKEDLHCTPAMRTMNRSLLGEKMPAEWDTVPRLLQVLQLCFDGSFHYHLRCKSLNKLARELKSRPVKLQYWPFTGPLRIPGFLGASYRNNDGSSQRHDSVLGRIA